jgi:DNA-binding NarL/FixJ family response regulator
VSNARNWTLPFTSREREVLALLQQGSSNKLIAHHLGMAEATAKVHMHNIMKKTGTTNRLQVLLHFMDQPEP